MEKLTSCQCSEIHTDAVAKAQDQEIRENLLQPLASIFRILGDPTRLRIVQALSTTELCVCDLASMLGMSQSAISHQLAMLRHTRLVRHRRDGKIVFYSLDDEHVSSLLRIGLEHVQEDRGI